MIRRILSILLVICMMISMMPLTARAENVTEDGHEHSTVQETGEELAQETEESTAETTEEETEETTVEETQEATQPVTEPEPVCTCESDDAAFHATNCPLYETPENPQCFCAEKCSEPNIWCDICGFDISRCGGEDTAATYEGCDHSVKAILGYVSGSSNTHSHEAEEYLLDGDPGTKWCGDFGAGYDNYVIFTAGGPSILTSYTLTTGADTGSEFRHYRNWTAWTLYGSNSPDKDWVVIDQVTGANLPKTDSTESKPFPVNPHTPYTYYKLEVNAVFALGDPPSQQMADITIQKLSYDNGACTECGAACPHEYALPLHYKSGSSDTDSSEADRKLLDGDPGTKWCSPFERDGKNYVIFSADSATFIESYTLTTGNDTDYYPGRNWKTWTLYGSNSADGEWVQIHKVENADLPAKSKVITEPFSVDHDTPYKYFKLEVNAVKSEADDAIHQMADITINHSESCILCKAVCQEHDYVGNVCSICDTVCYHETYVGGFCPECGTEHDHTAERFADGVYPICGYVCPHTSVLPLKFEYKGNTSYAAFLVDGDPDTSWQDWNPKHYVWKAFFSTPAPAVVKSYTLTVGHYYNKVDPGEHWTSWILSGSHSLDGDWTVIDQVVDTTLVVDKNRVSQTFKVDPHIPYAYYKLEPKNMASLGEGAVFRMAEINITAACYQDGACILCENSCSAHSYVDGYCRNCLQEHNHKGETYTAGKGDICGFVCPHANYGNDYRCSVCKTPCTHKFQGIICQICKYGCNHTAGYDAGFCKRCGLEHDHTDEGYTDGAYTICHKPCLHVEYSKETHKCIVCQIACSHEKGHTNGVCNVCETVCDHKSGYSATGFCNTCEQYEPAPQNNDGVYQISNAGQLYWFAAQVNSGITSISAELTCNIDVGNSPTNGIWTPIATSIDYTGTFDGKGHTVDGIVVENRRENGFFSKLSWGGVIKNLGLGPNCTVMGFLGTGGICGVNRGTIDCCWYLGTVDTPVMADYEDVDGITGLNYGTIKNCWFNGDTNNPSYVNGICGANTNLAQNSYFGVNGNNSAFATGEIAFKLQAGMETTELVWGQNLDNRKPRNDNPVMAVRGGAQVYEAMDCQGSNSYSNNSAGGSHRFDEDSKCMVCGVVCYHQNGFDGDGCNICGNPCSHGELLELNHVADSGEVNNAHGDLLIDGDPYTYYQDFFKGQGRDYIIFSVDEATVLRSYILTTYKDYDAAFNRLWNWKGWSLYGSDSAEGPWTRIHKVEDGNLPTMGATPSDPFVVQDHSPCRYFKVVVDSAVHNKLGQYIYMGEFTVLESYFEDGICSQCNFSCTKHSFAEGYCKVCGVVCQHTGGYTAGYCNDCGLEHDHTKETCADGVHTVCGYPCSHEEILPLTFIEGSDDSARNLLDGDPFTIWKHEVGDDGQNYVVFNAGNAALVDGYALQTPSVESGGMPWKSWTLYGKNSDDEDWSTVHSVKNIEADLTLGVVQGPYTISNVGPYDQFKLVLHSIPIINGSFEHAMADVILTRSCFQGDTCSKCGYSCQTHNYSGGVCTNCRYVCPHSSFTADECDICDYICQHNNYGTDHKCILCKMDCLHERGYTNTVCNACGTVCDHRSGYCNTGFCNTCEDYEPAFLKNGVYKISNAGQLYWFAEQVGRGGIAINGELASDIDLKANTPNKGSWMPMGSVDQPYQGTFDGKGHTVDNVKIWKDQYVGFISVLGENGVVRNLGMGKNCDIKGLFFTGGICGQNDGLIEGCWYSGEIYERSYLKHDNTIEGGKCGGIVGVNSGIVTNCWFDGLLNASGDDGYHPYSTGGIVGMNANGLVENCYNIGILHGWDYYGGIAGEGDGEILHCYSVMPYKKTISNAVSEPNGLSAGIEIEITNSYYESAYEINNGQEHGVLRDTFSSGELAYKLQRDTEADNKSDVLVWGQNLDNGKPRDDHPIQAFRGAPRVYQVTDCEGNTYYSNSSSNGRHRFGSDGKCPCGAQCPHESTACMDQGNGSHNHVCTLCGYVTATESHTFDPVTELCECGAKCGHSFENGICTNCGAYAVTIPAIEAAYDAEVQLWVYAVIPDEMLADDNAYMEMIKDSAYDGKVTTRVTAGQLRMQGKTSYSDYQLPQGMASGEMTKQVTYKFYDGKGNPVTILDENGREVGTEISYSIMDYVDRILQRGSEKQKNIVKYLVTYGGYAQNYFSKKFTGANLDAQNPAYNILLEQNIEVPSLTGVAADSITNAVTLKGENAGIQYNGAEGYLDSAIYLRSYFLLTGNTPIDSYDFVLTYADAAGITRTMSLTPTAAGGEYYVDIPDIPAAYLDYDYVITITNNENGETYTVTTSILAWIKNGLAKFTNEDQKNMLKAMYLYNQAANQFFGK